ncbi:hypothetical protein B0H14DRAFT_190824 [Mycena olivaceomarginata]|nr:hypothetical protein B0H14DRAFT_190824 [Mycena olivaceomarginata]
MHNIDGPACCSQGVFVRDQILFCQAMGHAPTARPPYTQQTPTFIDRSEITGSLKLNLRSPDPIKSITVFVRGYLLISEDPLKHSKFFRLQKLVWTPSMGDPRAPGTSDAGNT